MGEASGKDMILESSVQTRANESKVTAPCNPNL